MARMSRRRLVVLVSAAVLATLVMLAIGAVRVLTHTEWGQERLQRLFADRLKSMVPHGSVYLGRVSGSFLTGITVDSIAIRDRDDSLFLSAGRITLDYDPRDLLDKRLLLRNVTAEHPVVVLKQHQNSDWNYLRIFRRGVSTPRAPGRAFGDFIVFDSVRLTDARFVLTMPWQPADSLRGAKRDSAVRAELTRKDKEIRAVAGGYTHTWQWNAPLAVLAHVHLADPDSAARLFVIDTLHADETEPPFAFRNINGSVRLAGDSLWLNVKHFDLPASTGKGIGKIWWGGKRPTRYLLRITGDSVSLADVAWVYPTLPREGGGSVLLEIENDARNPRVLLYRLTGMDVRSTKSRLRGQMTFAVGDSALRVEDVKLTADPADWDLIRTFNGKPLPVDWQGQLTGTLTAAGGTLSRFMIDDANLTFKDAHVAGAESRMQGHGELDIQRPAFTVFHGFDVSSASIDLRSIEYLYPKLPKLGGVLSGSARLDSIWTDVFFSNADLTHTVPEARPTHLTGGGRITTADEMSYDLAVRLDSLSFPALRRSYPNLPLRGVVGGTVRARGTLKDLGLTTTLAGKDGGLTFDGRVNALGPVYGVIGTGTFSALDPFAYLTNVDTTPRRKTLLEGEFGVDIRGSARANLQGSAFAALWDPSMADGVRISKANAAVRFADERLWIDSLKVESVAGLLMANGGALGLHAGVKDSISLLIVADSLGGLRQYLPRRATDREADSLAGTLSLAATLIGSLDTVLVTGRLAGTDLLWNGDKAPSLEGRFTLADVFRRASGTLDARLDAPQLFGIKLDTLGASIDLANPRQGTFRVEATSRSLPSLTAAGSFARQDAATRVAVDSLALHLGETDWRLARTAPLQFDSHGTTIDSLLLVTQKGGRFALAGVVPDKAPVSLTLQADNVPVADLASFLHLPLPLTGVGSIRGIVSGTREQPQGTLDVGFRSLEYGSLKVERVTARADYNNRRLTASGEVFRDGRVELAGNAQLPVSLANFKFEKLPDSMRVEIRGDSSDLAILEAITPAITNARGRMAIAMTVGGTWRDPNFEGRFRVREGEAVVRDAGVALHGISADIKMFGSKDSIAIDSLKAWSGRSAKDSWARVTGYIKTKDWSDPELNLKFDAQRFRVLDKKSLARLDITTNVPVSLTGFESSATLRGTVRIDEGQIFIPDRAVASKRLVEITTGDIDTTDVRARQLLPSPPSKLVENLRISGVKVTMGDNVYLKSAEANIKLGGQLDVTRSQDTLVALRPVAGRQTLDSVRYRLTLEGVLTADRGYYRLDVAGAFQRDFQVEPGGWIRFAGTPDLNPEIRVSALYEVRQLNRPDAIRVRARLDGNLYPQPRLKLESADGLDMDESNLFSYLCCGVPAFQLGGDKAGQRTIASLLLPTANSLLTRAFTERLPWLDQLSFQAGATDVTASGYKQSALEFFAGSRFSTETRINRNLWFSLSAGLCQLDQSQTVDRSLAGFADQLGGKLMYRLSSTSSLEGGREPPSSALSCGRIQGGFITTPPQWGVSYNKRWFFR